MLQQKNHNTCWNLEPSEDPIAPLLASAALRIECLSQFGAWVTEDVLAVDAVVEQRHVGGDSPRLVLVEHGAEGVSPVRLVYYPICQRAALEQHAADIRRNLPLLVAIRALDVRALQSGVVLEVLRRAGLLPTECVRTSPDAAPPSAHLRKPCERCVNGRKLTVRR